MRKRSLSIIISLVTVLCGSIAGAGAMSKPQLPIDVTVGPVQADATVRPGEDVEMAVSGTARTAIDEMRIEVRLEGGAELVSGSRTWSGPASQGETKQLIFTVHAPAQGNGKIVATVTMFKDGKPVVGRTGQYVLGIDQGQRTLKPAGVEKKDSQGRKIIEY